MVTDTQKESVSLGVTIDKKRKGRHRTANPDDKKRDDHYSFRNDRSTSRDSRPRKRGSAGIFAKTSIFY
jgi:hypothetical protein